MHRPVEHGSFVAVALGPEVLRPCQPLPLVQRIRIGEVHTLTGHVVSDLPDAVRVGEANVLVGPVVAHLPDAVRVGEVNTLLEPHT